MKTVLVTRRVPQEVISRLQQHFVVRTNEEDVLLSGTALIARAKGCWGVFANLTERFDKEVISALLPELKIISTMSVGINHIDAEYAKQQQVMVANTPGVLTETTADLALALMLATCRRVTEAEMYLRNGQWKEWSFDLLCGRDLHNSTVGIVGFGKIGQAIARRAHFGFGCKIRYHQRNRDMEAESLFEAHFDSKLDTLLENSSFVVLVLPYSAATHHLIGREQIRKMRRDAFLINVARGGIVNDKELAEELKLNTIAGAGLDVFEGEPQICKDLLDLKNVCLLPHIGSATKETRLAMATLAAGNLIAYATPSDLQK